ncbi:hypothetical protein GW17_00039793 [Ensete ventricosum]|nr:hypothetical protein GW17_00039793 [Ensete ventricosum]
MADPGDSSPLIAPVPVPDPNDIDLEAGPGEQFQCRICLETDGRDFIAPCKCKGTSKYVHRECLDHWRAVKVSVYCLRLPIFSVGCSAVSDESATSLRNMRNIFAVNSYVRK